MLITVANYRQFTNFRQFTSPYVLDSLKPQLKLVQSSVGDQEVMDYHHMRCNQTLPDYVSWTQKYKKIRNEKYWGKKQIMETPQHDH